MGNARVVEHGANCPEGFGMRTTLFNNSFLQILSQIRANLHSRILRCNFGHITLYHEFNEFLKTGFVGILFEFGFGLYFGFGFANHRFTFGFGKAFVEFFYHTFGVQ